MIKAPIDLSTSRPSRLAALAIAALSGIHTSAQAQIAWDEIGNGDLSNLFSAPTHIPVLPGDNIVYGNMGEGASGIDRDYFTITVPAGHLLTSIWIDLYQGDDPIGFLGMVLGTAFPLSGDDSTTNDVDGYVLFGTAGLNVPGTDVLPRIPEVHQPQRFTIPLAPGHYSFWVQQLDGLADYGLNFVIAVPAPGVATCLALAGAWSIRRNRETPHRPLNSI